MPPGSMMAPQAGLMRTQSDSHNSGAPGLGPNARRSSRGAAESSGGGSGLGMPMQMQGYPHASQAAHVAHRPP